MITNKTRRKSSLLGAVALLSALFLLCLSLISCTKSKDTPSEDTLLSPAISILADRATIAKAALVGAAPFPWRPRILPARSILKVWRVSL